MSADTLRVHLPIRSKGILKNKERCDGVRPQITNPSFIDPGGDGGQVMKPFPRFYENPLKHTRQRSPSPRPLMNRIHSPSLPKRRAIPPIIPSGPLSTSPNKENLAPGTEATKYSSSYASKSAASWSARSIHSSSPIRSPDEKSDRPLTLALSGSLSTDTNTLHSIMPKNHRTKGAYAARRAQGHKVPPRPLSAKHLPEVSVTTQDFVRHRREVHTAVSTLGSRVDALENTIAAALPVVAEARLLWMENAIVRSPVKLGTTRRAFYGNIRYETYTLKIRTRAYYLGLTVDDLEYLYERLGSLGFQSAKQETLLISPFGGENELGDKTMIEAYRRDSKHGAYARRIWKVCYENVYSVDEDWMLPVPIPDNLTLVEKIEGWLHGS